jgi:hypothetical protein
MESSSRGCREAEGRAWTARPGGGGASIKKLRLGDSGRIFSVGVRSNRKNQRVTTPRERPPGTPQEHSPRRSHAFTEMVQELPRLPVSTLRPVTRGAAA